MMLKKSIGTLLAVILLTGTLAACTPAAPPPAAAEPPVTPPAGAEPAPPPAAEPAPVIEAGLQRGIIVGTRDEPPSVAPGRHRAVAGGYMNVMNFNGLFKICADTLLAIPDLVSEWVAVSDTVFEFTLHEGVLFHNGEVLTAYDVVASWDYVRNYPYTSAERLSVYEYEAIGPLTLRVNTGEPNSMLFTDLAHSGNMIMPRSLIEQGHDFNELPIGTGPYVFQYWRSGDSLHHTAFEEYFDVERASRVESVTWRIIPEGASRTIALEMGEVDYIMYVAPTDITRLQAHPDIEMVMIPGVAHNKLLLNNDLPQFSDQRVRRAMGMAIDKEAMALVGWEGFVMPSWSQVPTVFAGATDEGTYSFDPEGARALLAETGIDPATLGFSIIASNDERRRMGEVVQANLADLGIPVTIEMTDLATMLAVTTDGDFEAAFGGATLPTFLANVRAVLHIDSINGPNRSRVYNRELSDLIDRAITTIDQDERLALYGQISRVANEHTGSIPTHHSFVLRAFNSNLVVPELSSAGALHLNVMYWVE